jgi:hypothetical protein
MDFFGFFKKKLIDFRLDSTRISTGTRHCIESDSTLVESFKNGSILDFKLKGVLGCAGL